MAKRKIPENTKWFVYENLNPKNKSTCDCVIRTLASALEMDYFNVWDMLLTVTKKTGYHPTSRECITKVLSHYVKQNQPKHSDGTKFTGKQFCELYTKGTYIVSIGTLHFTVVKDGQIHDTWDCSRLCVGNFWKVK